MAIATVMLALGSRLGEMLRRHWRIGAAAVLMVQFCLGVYGGYFGGGVGIMMMAVWSLLGERTLKSFNAPRTLLVSAANTIAVLIFIAAQSVRWREALVMLAAAMLGGYLRRADRTPRARRRGAHGNIAGLSQHHAGIFRARVS